MTAQIAHPRKSLLTPFRRNLGKSLGLLVLFVVSAAVLYYASWVHSVQAANVDFDQGRYEQALAGYRSAQQGFLSHWSAVPGFQEPVREAALKQIQILYLYRRFEEGMELLQRAGSQHPFLDADAQYHEWYGNMLFQRTIQQEDAQALLDGLRATLSQYQKALELDPQSWDARYNFEMLKRALEEEAASGQERLDLLLQQLRDNTRRDKQDKLPPEKRG